MTYGILRTATLAVAGLMALSVADLSAQRPRPAPVERALRLADELELTDDQRTRLEALRVETLEERTARAALLLRLQSEVQAGIREPEALRLEMESLRDDAPERGDRVGGPLQEILTEDQSDRLKSLTRGPRGRRGLDRQRGPRGRRFGPGDLDRGRRPGRGFPESGGAGPSSDLDATDPTGLSEALEPWRPAPRSPTGVIG